MSDGELTRMSGVPDEVYAAPRYGDTLSLVAVRTHLGRCTTCRSGRLCDTADHLVRALRARQGAGS